MRKFLLSFSWILLAGYLAGLTGCATTSKKTLSVPQVYEETVSRLLKDLNSPKPSIGEKSVADMIEKNPKAKEELVNIINNLKAEDFQGRLYSLSELWVISLDVKILIAGFNDPDKRIRTYAAEALGGRGLKARTAVSALVSTLGDEDKRVIRVSIQALGKIISEAEKTEPEYIKKGTLSFSVPTGKFTPEAKEAVLGLSKLLNNPDPHIRGDSVVVLGKIGPASKDAIPELIKRLNDPITSIKISTVMTLRNIGPAAETAVPALIERLFEDENEQVRIRVAWTLGSLGRTSESVARILIPKTKDKDPEVKKYAVMVLGNMGFMAKQYESVLLESLKDEDKMVKKEASIALGRIGSKAQSKNSILIENLRNGDRKTRERAAMTLRNLAPKVKEAIPAFIESLKNDQNQKVRYYAANALGRYGPVNDRVVPALINGLTDKHKYVRAASAESLSKMGQKAKPAIPALKERLKDEDNKVRSKAAMALAKIDVGRTGFKKGDAAFDTLIENLKNSDKKTRIDAALSLRNIGFKARTAGPALAESLKDKDPEVRMYAAMALGAIQSTEAVPALIESLNDENQRVRLFVAEAFKKLLTDDKTVAPALIKRLKEEKDPGVRAKVAEALGRISRKEKIAVPHLLESLKDPELVVRQSSARGLSYLGPNAKEAVPILTRYLKEGNEEFKGYALMILNNIGFTDAKSEDTVPYLIANLKHKKMLVRRDSLSALEKLGPKAKTAVPEIIKLVNDKDLGYFAVRTLGFIGPGARDAVPILNKNLQAENKEIQITAAMALSMIEANPEKPLSMLIKHANDEDLKIRNKACWALADVGKQLGTKAKAAIPILTERLKDRDLNGNTSYAASKALENIKPKPVSSSVNSEYFNIIKSQDVDKADKLKALLDKGVDVDTKIDDFGQTALGMAVAMGNIEIVKLLLERGADVNAQSEKVPPPLMRAMSGNTKIVTLLLDAGADVNAIKGGMTVLTMPALMGHADAVKLLLKRGADINAHEKNGLTTLMHVAQNGRANMVKLLLEKGADVNVTNSKGETALNLARKKNHSEIVSLLVNAKPTNQKAIEAEKHNNVKDEKKIKHQQKKMVPAKKTENKTSDAPLGNCIEGNCIDGHGTLLHPGEVKYVGEFKNGKAHGKGTIFLPDGRQITGMFKNDKFVECEEFPDKLKKCEKYSCEFMHPFTAELMKRDIIGKFGDKCKYAEEMPNGGKMECNYSKDLRTKVAQYFKLLATSESQKFNVEISLSGGKVKTVDKFDGKEVENPLQEAMNTGQCVISGYGIQDSESNVLRGQNIKEKLVLMKMEKKLSK